MKATLARSASLILVATLLASCSGGARSSTIPQTSSPDAAYTGPLANATFTIRIPNAASASGARSRKYVSPATKSVKMQLTGASALTSGQITAYNARSSWSMLNVTAPSSACVASGADFVCTMAVQVPPGNDNITFSTYDNTGGAGNILSQQIVSVTVVAGVPNGPSGAFSFTFDANASTMTISSASNYCQNGTIGSTFGSVGTSPITFNVAFADAASKTIVSPGLPKIEIEDNTSTYQSSNGTIAGTGGNVTFTINQSAQQFVLTPSSSTITNATVNVKAVPPNSTGSSDGLSFAKTQSFTFSTGSAPPSHNFLAAVEQYGTGSGAVDFFNVTLGGSGGPDSFGAYSPATLATTNSTNANQPDVDNPQEVAWDSTGDLLIGNGGTTTGTPPDYGNLACVPVGAIATGANTSTTISTNVDDPVGIAYDSRDGSVALANQGNAATYQLSEYLLTGNYTAAGASRNLAVPGYGADNGVVNVPTMAAGSYAIGLTTGLEADTAHGGNGTGSKIAILDSTAAETDISPSGTGTYCGQPSSPVGACTTPATYAVDVPWGLAWDSANSQLVVSNYSTWHRLVSFYTLNPVTQVKVINTGGRNTIVATSTDGHVAVVSLSPAGSGYPRIIIYDNTAARNTVGAPIPFNGTTTSCGSTYTYGGGVVVNGMTWLSNTKLLVALQTTQAANNGLYIFDISVLNAPAGFDDKSCSAFSASAMQTTFVHIANKPLGIAFKP